MIDKLQIVILITNEFSETQALPGEKQKKYIHNEQ